jgi:hypothetical protein
MTSDLLLFASYIGLGWSSSVYLDSARYRKGIRFLKELPTVLNSAIFVGFLIYKHGSRPIMDFCLFPLSDRPTKIAATQNILLPHLMKNYFFFRYFFHSHYTWTRWMCLITLLLNIDQQTSPLVKNIICEWSLLSIILMIEGKNKIFLLPTYPYVKLLSRKGGTNNILI